MKAQAYLDMMKRQQQELTDFPIAYAFNEKQLEEALEKLGATKEECCTYLNMGDVMKKTDVPAFKAMLKRHTEELQNAMKNEQFALDLIFKTLVDDKVDYSYLTTMPESTEQTNSIMLDLILRKYSRKYRRFKRQQKKGE